MRKISKVLITLLLCLSMTLSLVACSKAPAGKQTLEGVGKGIHGDVVVEVVADENEIYSVTVKSHDETPGIGTIAVDEIPGKIVAQQSVLVDVVTTATVTSNAIIDAVRAALESGKIDVTKFEKVGGADETVRTDTVVDDYDIIVVGAGGAGLTAAVAAATNGASVVVLEKMPLVGGNSLRAEGGMNAASTGVQAKLGITDSTVETYIEDTMRLGHDINDLALVTKMAEDSSDAVNWLAEVVGAPLEKVGATGGTSHKYLHSPESGEGVGSYLVSKLSAKADELGIKVMLNTEATELLTDDSGAVVGVKAFDKEHNYTFNSKAVVLATGGFGANFEKMASYDPSLANAVTTNHSGATGDGIAMAEAVGAATVDMEQIQLHPTVYQATGALVSESVRTYGGILVNASGNRFTNDFAGRDIVSQAELKEGGDIYIVFDEGTHQAKEKLIDKYISGGLTMQGNTPAELAAAIGVDADNLEATIAKWNETVNSGSEDEFGRDGGFAALETAPYYAIKVNPGIHHTMGGIKINTNTEVISTTGNVIAGLFAAGETTGGVHGGNRVGGNAVADFTVFGRIAGNAASEYVK